MKPKRGNRANIFSEHPCRKVVKTKGPGDGAKVGEPIGQRLERNAVECLPGLHLPVHEVVHYPDLGEAIVTRCLYCSEQLCFVERFPSRRADAARREIASRKPPRPAGGAR